WSGSLWRDDQLHPDQRQRVVRGLRDRPPGDLLHLPVHARLRDRFPAPQLPPGGRGHRRHDAEDLHGLQQLQRRQLGSDIVPVGRRDVVEGARLAAELLEAEPVARRSPYNGRMSASGDGAFRLALVGTGAQLVKAIETLRGLGGVRVIVVADASDRSEGGKLAKSLHLLVIKNPMDVYRTDANLVLEVNGDER